MTVSLDDVSQIDAPSRRVAWITLQPPLGVHDLIAFSIDIGEGALDGSDYIFSAEVRRDGKRPLRAGDFLSVVAHPWHPRDASGDVMIHVHEV